MDLSKYRTSAEILGIIVLMVSLGVNVIDTDQGYIPYSCEKENVPDYMCYKLSRVNDNGIQRNCYYDRDNSRSYKVCSTGWKQIINIDEYGTECHTTRCIAYTEEGTYVCNGCGSDAVCTFEDDLSQKTLDELGW